LVGIGRLDIVVGCTLLVLDEVKVMKMKGVVGKIRVLCASSTCGPQVAY